MDHLACFMAGNLALGAVTSNDPVRAARDLRTGKVCNGSLSSPVASIRLNGGLLPAYESFEVEKLKMQYIEEPLFGAHVGISASSTHVCALWTGTK